MHDPYLPYGNRHHSEPIAGAPALEISHLNVSHPGTPDLALTDVSLQVPVGTRVALVGHNGAGKSTLLKAVAGLLKADGEIRIYGQPVGACHHRVAYLPQRGEIDWRFPISMRRLVMTGRYVHLGWLKRPRASDREIVDAMLEQLKLTDLAERQIGQLSGGQQQRAMLARSLTQESDLLLLDEPLNAVDVDTREIISRVLDGLKKQGKTLIVATHDIGRIESDFDNAVYLSDGKIVSYQPSGIENHD